MGKGYLIDTNAVIDYLDNKLPDNANELLDSIDSNISVITRIELLSWPNAKNEQTDILKEFISVSKNYSLEEPIIIEAIHIRKTYKTKLPDAIIAATAIVKGLKLITRNLKDFDKINGLTVINPYYMFG